MLPCSHLSLPRLLSTLLPLATHVTCSFACPSMPRVLSRLLNRRKERLIPCILKLSLGKHFIEQPATKDNLAEPQISSLLLTILLLCPSNHHLCIIHSSAVYHPLFISHHSPTHLSWLNVLPTTCRSQRQVPGTTVLISRAWGLSLGPRPLLKRREPGTSWSPHTLVYEPPLLSAHSLHSSSLRLRQGPHAQQQSLGTLRKKPSETLCPRHKMISSSVQVCTRLPCSH